jgi:hypothetical protein
MIVPFKAEHLAKLSLQSTQLAMSEQLTNPEYATMLEGTYAYSLIEGDEVLCCAGLMPVWENRSMGWALVSSKAGKHFIEIHRNVAAAIRMCPDRRVEIAVDSEFAEGKRWAKMLGLTFEGRMRGYGVDGRDHDLFARVK